MRHNHILIAIFMLCIGIGIPLNAQQTCGPEVVADDDDLVTSVFINSGSRANLKNQTYRSSVAVGQYIVGSAENTSYNTTTGFYARYLLPPFGLRVSATQGDLLDRILVTWEIDALGPLPNQGFIIKRNGEDLVEVGPNIRSYNDFNVIPGVSYEYTVYGVNSFGAGPGSKAIGYQVPNGVVTGWVSTNNGSPVPDAQVTLTPMQGFSAEFDPQDEAFALADTTLNPFLPATGEDWTIAFWIKTSQSTGDASIIHLAPEPLYIRAINTIGSSVGGIVVSSTSGGGHFLFGYFPNNATDWQHVAITFDGVTNKGRLYINGILRDISQMNPVISPDTLQVGGHGDWTGRLDELRIYERRLDELDFAQVMEGTASSQTPFLTHYWKMDEEKGDKSYDIMKRHKLYFCGADFDAERPPVHTAGISNSEGYYRIESANYGTGTTFLAKPKKNFYLHRALKFNRNQQDYAELPNFGLTSKSTVELWVNSAGPDGTQCLLSKKWNGNEFNLMLVPTGLQNKLVVSVNGENHTYDTLANGYHHLALQIGYNGAGNIDLYTNGEFAGANNFNITGNWSNPDEPWILGARKSGATMVDHYGGLIDEIAVYDTILPPGDILAHFEGSRPMQEAGLRVYFPLDEGSGNRLTNVGSMYLEYGNAEDAEWSVLAVHQVVEPHVFTPSTRQVTLNPSVTSVDQVDFTDRSTIPVTGFVRYQNTDCFASGVEILVNGAPYNPRIVTDTNGRFVIEFDPGFTATLTPVFEDHTFSPAYYDVTNVSSPMAGIVFTNTTTTRFTGKVVGGLCKKSVIRAPAGQPTGTICVVRAETLDQCFRRDSVIRNQEGEFQFNDIPPFKDLVVSVISHDNPTIFEAFETQGGFTIDVSQSDTVHVEFIYTAQPVIEISGLDEYASTCDSTIIVLDQGSTVTLGIRLKEIYESTPVDDGICYLDTAALHIIDGFADVLLDTAMSGGFLEYRFEVGVPNPTPPYRKTFQIISSTVDGNDSEITRQAVVTGIRTKDNTFTTVLPEIPTLVLRDPPGDGSYSYLEKEEKVCQKISFTKEISAGDGVSGLLDVGPDIVIPAPVEISIINNWGFTMTGLTQIRKVENNAIEVCNSFSERISTSDDELIVGGHQGGDVYMGGGMNVEFGFADIVTFDTTLCEAIDSITVIVVPGNYATTFMYSEWNIENNVIRYLKDLDSLSTDTAQQAIYQESIARWTSFLDANKDQKRDAKFIRNVSFDAGVEYEYAEISDTARTGAIANTTTVNMVTDVNALTYILGIGGGAVVHITHEEIESHGQDSFEQKGLRTGYVLADNDPADAFTLDVKMDSVYKTPVFITRAGQSSCPWEYPTAKREGVLLTSVDGPERIDVPADQPATFHFILGNVSATNETFTYAFTAGPESNPHGAKIYCNGAAMNQIQWYAVPYGTSIPVTVTVERGPIEYDYDSLEIVLYSACEDIRANALGILPDTAVNLYSAVYVSAHFLRPCSEVNINVPEQDWVLFPDPQTPGDDNLRRITLSGYDTTEVNFQLVRVQYRRSDGDGTWINIPGESDIYNPLWTGFDALPDPKPPVLQKDFTHAFWQTAGLADGPYEIRAVTVCTGDASGRPGASEVIKGRIDREPPSLVGLPQPSDGVFHVGDEISFTFNQTINCNKVLFDNVILIDAGTNEVIDGDATCVDNKIVFNPTFDNPDFENRILRAELHEIEDLTGNVLIYEDWEFYVDRNELAWLKDSIGVTKHADETKTITAKIHNRGGYPVPFTIQDVPDWVHVSPDAGILVANEVLEIQFTIDSLLDLGNYSDTINLQTEAGLNPWFMGGTEPLLVGVRNLCTPPDWNVDPSLYANTMSMNIRLNINGTFSVDPEDQIGVFIDGALRGIGKLTYLPTYNTWVAFITVYGNTGDEGKPLVYEIFDISECLHYPGNLDGTFNFVSNSLAGFPNAPRVLTNSSMLLREVHVNTGWNWISFNLGFPDPAINKVLNNIPSPTNDLIKDKNNFAVYSNPGWSGGALNTIVNKTLYMYQANKKNVIKITGNPLTPSAVPIPIANGWTWIGYVPNFKLPVNTALASLVNAQPGDIIKGQTSFATYINATLGWVGSLTHLYPLQGYMVKTGAGTLTYPNSFTGNEPVETRGAESLPAYWTVDAAQYEHNMTFIGMFEYNGANATTENMELGAFVGEEIRGATQAVYIESLDAYMFFMTSFANTSGEQMRFKLYDPATGEILLLQEQVIFGPNYHQGSIDAPLPFTLQSTATGDVTLGSSFEVVPNPFRYSTTCRFDLEYAQEVNMVITDMSGHAVASDNMFGIQGQNRFTWNVGETLGSELSSGVYVIRIHTAEGIMSRKVVLLR